MPTIACRPPHEVHVLDGHDTARGARSTDGFRKRVSPTLRGRQLEAMSVKGALARA